MGNAASSASGQRATPRPRQTSASPSPGNPHPSLRTKKKSLELPDLALLTLSSTRGRQPDTPPKSASIPIPAPPLPISTVPGEAGRTRAPITLPSHTDVHLLDHHHQPPTHQVFPPPSRANRDRGRDRERDRDRDRDRDAHHRSRNRRIQELYDQSHQAPIHHHEQQAFVQETVSSTLPIGLTQVYQRAPELVPVKITWRGGGKSIFLARAGDDDWKGRLAMTPEAPGSNVYHATVKLPPGTHHIRFLIDDLWRVADDLPTAVDDQGSLANYVAVPINYSPPSTSTVPVPASPPVLTTKTRPGQSFWSAASSTSDDDPAPSTQPQPTTTTTSSREAKWTSVLPPELLEAAHEEEAYLAASEGHAHGAQGTHRVAGFVPAPNIPPAPGLPRHLDKLILNARAVVQGGAVVGSGAVPVRKNGSNGNGTGSARKAREGRERRDTWRDRDRRDRDRGRNPPPPPPPTEADVEPDLPAVPIPVPTPARVDSSGGVTPTPATLVPSTPTPTPGPGPGPGSPFLPSSTSTLTPVSPALIPIPSNPSTAPSSTPASPTPHPAARPLAISLDTDDNTIPLTDDASVLPVPSHVVLHHLSTSAIRNGVLAVGTTTRYRKKYLTSIYYKPTYA